ncbi:hypothetical protein [Aeromonas caviae]|uniref:hypothetical protein n=1 Tax=Aeromonas caviae TaxID=648 RepID=UPI001FB99556|nr:hypothetical protein [Aeromonas caviae]GKR02554.1 hypothetical protein KAM462_22740 [Aeromonas caviae]GKR09142.1 hypothetical protein KAM465_07190 [Aeromonas caviae]GKR13331.1 hypothetical protein KAM466_06490 [Aeromonas caviae]GKR23666.1 hypothetical protein KAM468_24060 [Aeromonas caviae]GKR27836.1 hypothetical protein KAM469_22950 [Aeromonas caviae]
MLFIDGLLGIMTVVYITKANFKRIATYVSHSISGVKGIESLYTQKLSRILAAPEMKLLSAVKLIVESVSDHEVLFKLIKFAEDYKPRERSRKDRWIYLGGAPAYHKKRTAQNSCQNIKTMIFQSRYLITE